MRVLKLLLIVLLFPFPALSLLRLMSQPTWQSRDSVKAAPWSIKQLRSSFPFKTLPCRTEEIRHLGKELEQPTAWTAALAENLCLGLRIHFSRLQLQGDTKFLTSSAPTLTCTHPHTDPHTDVHMMDTKNNESFKMESINIQRFTIVIVNKLSNFFNFLVFGTGSHVAKNEPKAVLQIPLAECWDCRHEPPCLVLFSTGDQTQGFVYTRQVFYQLSFHGLLHFLNGSVYNLLRHNSRVYNLNIKRHIT